MDARLPAHVEISGLIRAVQGAGGFAMVVSKGERDAGVILILTQERDKNARLWERMPQLDGTRAFVCTREEDPENKQEFSEYLDRRTTQDPDTWLVELEVANPERFVPGLDT
ncbi:DUF1491 family protein [Qipengyuania sp. DGS5-3]|uniref:DUF1491 family protein n=1 Tax=Qipengyuania sp. DGS5-3 TaxID=3349632 RepID=UPI0036D3AE26